MPGGTVATTIAGSDAAGKSRRTSANAFSAGMFWGASALSAGFDVRSQSAGMLRPTKSPAASAHETAGRRSTAETTAFQKRECEWLVRRWGRNGIRPRSMRGPRSSRTPGSAVTDAATAHATTVIVAAARLSNVAVWTRKSPAIATIAVVPETITVRPEVRAVTSSAWWEGRPRRRSSRERIT